MKRFFLLLFALSPFGAAVSLHAQLVHVTIEGAVTEKFGGASWWTGPSSGVGAPALLDIFYDSKPITLIGDPPPGGNAPPLIVFILQPETSYWQLSYGQLKVSALFTSINIENTFLFLDTFVSDTLTNLNLELRFSVNSSRQDVLPVPPFPLLAPRSPAAGLTGYTSLIDFDTLSARGLGSGSLVIGVDSLRSELVIGSVAVPEASTYAYGAALLLGTVVLARRRKTGNII